LRPLTHERHQHLRTVDCGLINRAVDPSPTLAVPEPKRSLPGCGHKDSVEVEPEAAKHRSNVKMRDLGQSLGRTIADLALNNTHALSIAEWRGYALFPRLSGTPRPSSRTHRRVDGRLLGHLHHDLADTAALGQKDTTKPARVDHRP